MKSGAEIETERLLIRHWTLSADDRSAYHFFYSDPLVRRFYVTRDSREACDERIERLVREMPERGFNWAAVCRKGQDIPIGYSGLSRVNYETPFTPCVEIGWLFRPDVWGQGYATEAARALLEHGFSDLDLEEIVAFAVKNNTASIAVMERIGMVRDVGGDFIHPMVPDSHPHLQEHVLYRAKRGSLMS